MLSLSLIDIQDSLETIIAATYCISMAYELVSWITAMSQGMVGGRIEQTLLWVAAVHMKQLMWSEGGLRLFLNAYLKPQGNH